MRTLAGSWPQCEASHLNSTKHTFDVFNVVCVSASHPLIPSAVGCWLQMHVHTIQCTAVLKMRSILITHFYKSISNVKIVHPLGFFLCASTDIITQSASHPSVLLDAPFSADVLVGPTTEETRKANKQCPKMCLLLHVFRKLFLEN